MIGKNLRDLLAATERGKLAKVWDECDAAPDDSHLPKGEYVALLEGGKLVTAKTSTPGYCLTFRVTEGEYAGRPFWHTIWLTESAMRFAKRDLLKLGIKDIAELERPLPRGLRCKAQVVLRKEDSGYGYNRVKNFEVLGVNPPPPDPFAPPDDLPPSAAPTAVTEAVKAPDAPADAEVPK